MANEDYLLEELENESVKKSNNAKRIAAASGLLAAGGAVGYAATTIPTGEEEPIETLTEEDFEGVADAGANQVQTPEVAPQPVQPTRPVEPVQPETPEEEEVDISFEKTTHYYNENGELIGTQEEGTLDGHKFTLLDVDGDLRADVLGYDRDGNGVINEDEIVVLNDENPIPMGHATSQHDVQFLAVNEPEEPVEPYIIEEEKGLADDTIHNDFEDEKTGESYSHDYAENNEDYNNNGDIENYSASSDYAYNEDVKDESDYTGLDGNDGEYSDFANNEINDDMVDDFATDSIDLV